MPRINLLPLKAARKFDNARNELIGLGIVLLMLCLGLYGWFYASAAQHTALQAKVGGLEQNLSELAKGIQRVQEFKKQTQTLESKIEVITTLKKHKTGPAKLLNDLAAILNEQEKVWLTSITEKEGELILEGGAMEHENISEFQLALGRSSKFFSDIALVMVTAKERGGIQYLEWQITCKANYTAG